MAILDGKALTGARQKKRWTRDELSAATKPKIHVSTIFRIESGKTRRTQPKTLKGLAKALDVSAEDLCSTPQAEREVIKVRIPRAARNALTLVARRYQISREHVIAAAPLLFYIVAEQSLQERTQHVREVRNAACACLDVLERIRHLPRHYPVDEGALDCEEESIEARDLFGKMAEGKWDFLNDDQYNEDKENPFTLFLRSVLTKVSKSQDEIESVWWPPGGHVGPQYEICAKEAAVIVGGDAEAAKAILCGAVALHEMPKASPEERARWARAELERARVEFADMFGAEPERHPGETALTTPGDGAAS